MYKSATSSYSSYPRIVTLVAAWVPPNEHSPEPECSERTKTTSDEAHKAVILRRKQWTCKHIEALLTQFNDFKSEVDDFGDQPTLQTLAQQQTAYKGIILRTEELLTGLKTALDQDLAIRNGVVNGQRTRKALSENEIIQKLSKTRKNINQLLKESKNLYKLDRQASQFQELRMANSAITVFAALTSVLLNMLSGGMVSPNFCVGNTILSVFTLVSSFIRGWLDWFDIKSDIQKGEWKEFKVQLNALSKYLTDLRDQLQTIERRLTLSKAQRITQTDLQAKLDLREFSMFRFI